MSRWQYVHIALIFFVAILSFFVPLGPKAASPITWGDLTAMLIFPMLALPAVLSVQLLNPGSTAIWRRPSWARNPFSFSEPLQLFHLGVYVCLAQGLVTIARIAFSEADFYPEAFVPVALAIGVLLGLRLTAVVFRSKFEQGG